MTYRRFLWLTLFLGAFLAPEAVLAQVREEDDSEAIVRGGTKPSADGADTSKVGDGIVDQTNQFRVKQGLSKLEANEKLTEAAKYFAGYMAKTGEYGHTADGNRPADRAKKYGYEYCIVLENIAYQFSSAGFETKGLADKFVEGWKESPGHRKNMLDPDVTETGVAVAQSEETGYYYAVQMFGRPKSQAIKFEIANETDITVEYGIGDESFELPPNYTRTHTRCRPGEVAFQLPKGDDKKETATHMVRPDRGDRFIVASKNGRYTVQER